MNFIHHNLNIKNIKCFQTGIFSFFIEKILKLKTYFHNFFEIHGPWFVWNSWSMKFLKFMVHDFLKINVPRFLEIHGPWIFRNSWSMNFLEFMVHQLFGIQCPTIFCDFGLFNSLAQAGGGGPYYMIFHYQKHTVLNNWGMFCWLDE